MIEGMLQHVDLGKTLRAYLVDKLKFLPENFDPDVFTLESSPVDRCLRSAESFMFGPYPPASPNEVIPMVVGSSKYSDLCTPGHCKEMNEISSAFSHSEEVKEFAKKYVPTCKSALKAMGFSQDFEGLERLSSWACAFNCSHWSETPEWLTDEVVEIAYKTAGFNQIGRFSHQNHVGLFGSYVMRHILGDADQQIGGESRKKFAVFSAHDGGVSALLVFLGVRWNDNMTGPLYTSSIRFEYWRDDVNDIWVRFLYNGTPLKLRLFEEKTLVRFDEFRAVMNPHLNHCWDMHRLIGEVKLPYEDFNISDVYDFVI
jgi:acid phosphatase